MERMGLIDGWDELSWMNETGWTDGIRWDGIDKVMNGMEWNGWID